LFNFQISPFDALAKLAVSTLFDLLRVPHPAQLSYYAFDGSDGMEIRFPTLGLKLAARSPQGNASYLLLETLKIVTGISELSYDSRYFLNLNQE
jgi:hypothetical protein